MKAETVVSSKTVIYSHFSATGACEELKTWLLERRAAEVVYAAFPFSRSRETHVVIEKHQKGRLTSTHRSMVGFKKPEPMAYLRDVLLGLFYGLRYCRDAEVLVAGDNLLSIVGIILRKLGIVRRVVYYMIDYSPRRFPGRIANRIYLLADRLACHGADAVWALSPQLINARFERGDMNRDRTNWQVVPYGCHVTDAPAARNRNRIGYMGGIVKDKGAELFVPVGLELRTRGIPFEFMVIGEGPYLDTLRDDVIAHGLEDHFTLAGYVENFGKVLELLSSCGMAIAPYRPGDRRSFSYFADPGKIKTYLGCGLPIVLTNVPPIAAEIQERRAGILAEYSPAGFADGIMRLLDGQAYQEYAARARMFGESCRWDSVFSTAFSTLGTPYKERS